MNDTDMIVDVANRLFSEKVDKQLLDLAESGQLPTALWQALRETGFHEVGSHSSGTGYAELFALLRCAGEHAVPLPLAETLLGGAWAGSHDGITSIGRIQGEVIIDVAWGRAAERVIGITANSFAIEVDTNPVIVTQGTNMAGEARDIVRRNPNAQKITLDLDPAMALSTSRAVQMAGAMTSILAMSLTYASEREQFGRPISKFQVIQHQLAVMAAEVAASGRAADAAAAAISLQDGAIEVAAARSRVGEAAGIIAETSHQVHGAMGFTHEHRLHHFTRRLWAWRDEYGNETEWQVVLGETIARVGADNLWSFIASRG